MAGRPGTYVLSWAQTEIDGLRSAPVGAMVRGASWRRTGEAHRIDARSDILTLTDPEGGAELRRRAGRVARGILTRVGSASQTMAPRDIEDAVIERTAIVSDGLKTYPMVLIEITDVARPLVVFTEALPPEDALLHVVSEAAPIIPRRQTGPSPVLCFAAGTRLSTPRGPAPVETLRAGDLLMTRDAGPQPILWIGTRELSGARLHAVPELRPVRIVPEALGGGGERLDVSPDHRLLLRGAAARALFSEPEVLVMARDLVGWRGVRRTADRDNARYVHVMLPDHHVVWAHGVAADTFHPSHADMAMIDPEQLDGLHKVLPGGVQTYGATARRCLTSSEAAILLHEGAGRGALRQRA